MSYRKKHAERLVFHYDRMTQHVEDIILYIENTPRVLGTIKKAFDRVRFTYKSERSQLTEIHLTWRRITGNFGHRSYHTSIIQYINFCYNKEMPNKIFLSEEEKTEILAWLEEKFLEFIHQHGRGWEMFENADRYLTDYKEIL